VLFRLFFLFCCCDVENFLLKWLYDVVVLCVVALLLLCCCSVVVLCVVLCVMALLLLSCCSVCHGSIIVISSQFPLIGISLFRVTMGS
jgi:hypothetical protein